MTSVGFSSGAHDCAYSIFNNGYPVGLWELERFNRKKECSGQEYDIIDFFLSHRKSEYFDRFISFEMKWNGGIQGMWPDSFSKLGGNMTYIPHHTAHAASAFYASNFNNALIFSIDGGGDENGTESAFSIFLGRDNKLETLEVIPMSILNIGEIWSKLAKQLSPNGVGNQSGTVMAMAAFAEPKKNLVDHFMSLFYRKDYGLPVGDAFELAASIQEATEIVVADIVNKYLFRYPDINNVCFVGGVALNSSMLGKFLYLSYLYRNINIYVPPVPYDSGLALGVCQYYWHHILDNPKINFESFTPYLGQSYEPRVDGEKSSIEKVVDLLYQDKIVAIYGGPSECGRRALGNRSILASPLNPKMKDMINEKVKHRQSFRPFAPAILEEYVSDYFGINAKSPYMSLCLPFKSSKIDEVPAVVHKDGTGRLQTVNVNSNYSFYNLLKLWKEKSGCPILLNTSFNDREPIVETPKDALRCFKNTDIDYLYFKDTEQLIKK